MTSFPGFLSGNGFFLQRTGKYIHQFYFLASLTVDFILSCFRVLLQDFLKRYCFIFVTVRFSPNNVPKALPRKAVTIASKEEAP
jgi:hypothetical protein